jgi:FixJ family two-component response regulator
MVPVILLSGYPEEGALRQVVSEGGIRFLRKPCDVRNLAEEIETALAGRS